MGHFAETKDRPHGSTLVLVRNWDQPIAAAHHRWHHQRLIADFVVFLLAKKCSDFWHKNLITNWLTYLVHAKTDESISFGFSDRSVRCLVTAKRSANHWVQTNNDVTFWLIFGLSPNLGLSESLSERLIEKVKWHTVYRRYLFRVFLHKWSVRACFREQLVRTTSSSRVHTRRVIRYRNRQRVRWKCASGEGLRRRRHHQLPTRSPRSVHLVFWIMDNPLLLFLI